MKTFVADIIPRIQRFSQKLDNHTLLTNQHWVVFDDINSEKNVYIFRSNNQLLISKNGKVEKGNWESIGDNSILVDLNSESYLFKHGFFDENVLALKLDGKNEYAFLINESRYDGELNTMDRIIDFLRSTYIGTKRTSLPYFGANSKFPMKGNTQSELTKVSTDIGTIYVGGKLEECRKGARVYRNRELEPAKNGKYHVGFLWYIHVVNGVVEKWSAF